MKLKKKSYKTNIADLANYSPSFKLSDEIKDTIIIWNSDKIKDKNLLEDMKKQKQKKLEKLKKIKLERIKKEQKPYRKLGVVKTEDGLIWQDDKAVKTTKLNWEDAQEYCADLDLAGKSDWRLPDYDELLSLVDYTKSNPSIVNGFDNVASYYYWSSSPYVSYDSNAWYVFFLSGSTDRSDKSDKYYVRCVRGRQ